MGLFSMHPASTHASKPVVPTSGERRRPRDPQGGLSIVARDLSIVGELRAEGVVRIEGRVVGNVYAGDQVLLCEGGSIEGEVITREAVIGGQVLGSIAAEERVELQASAMVHGDIATRRLLIQEGGRVNGAVRMGGEGGEVEAQRTGGDVNRRYVA